MGRFASSISISTNCMFSSNVKAAAGILGINIARAGRIYYGHLTAQTRANISQLLIPFPFHLQISKIAKNHPQARPTLFCHGYVLLRSIRETGCLQQEKTKYATRPRAVGDLRRRAPENAFNQLPVPELSPPCSHRHRGMFGRTVLRRARHPVFSFFFIT